MTTKRLLSLISLLLVILLLSTACQPSGQTDDTTTTLQNPPSESPEGSLEGGEGAYLCGTALSEYAIVYSTEAPDYNKRAATYIRDEIKARTGMELLLITDIGEARPHEIVVGETMRPISKTLDADTDGTEFAFFCENGSVAMEGDYFIIAAAAYYFVQTYITSSSFDAEIPSGLLVCEPIVKEAKSFIFLIGDGMGIYQTRLFDAMTNNRNYSDGEDCFYGYYLPYQGFARTNSLSGTTDSAAAGTALACGYKTYNGYIGKNEYKMNIPSLTEIAARMGKATAVMSTEVQTGATPAAFSAHANDRGDTEQILISQGKRTSEDGTIIRCDFNVYTKSSMRVLENAITEMLDTLSQNENGFFMMYEEAHIDKHCHNNDINNAFSTVVRFNQAIGRFMEYAFYHPDTMVLITADHETGGLLPNGNGGFSYSHGNHSSQYVPIFAWGGGAECFNHCVVENVRIPKTIASLMGKEDFGDPAFEKVA